MSEVENGNECIKFEFPRSRDSFLTGFEELNQKNLDNEVKDSTHMTEQKTTKVMRYTISDLKISLEIQKSSDWK